MSTSRAAVRASVVSVLQAGVAFVLGVLTARALGPTGQGVVTTVVTTTSIAVLAASLGSGIALRVRARPRPDTDDLRAYAALSLAVLPLAAVATVAVVALVLRGTADPALLGLAALVAVALMAARQAADLCQAVGRTDAAIFSLLVLAVTQLAAFAVVLATGSARPTTVLACLLLGGAAQTAYCLLVSRGQTGALPRPGAATARGLLRLGLPSLGYSIGLILLQRVDRILLGAVAGPTVLGVYAAAATLSEVIRLLPSTIGQLIFSRVAEERAVTPDVRRLRRQLLLLAALCVLALEVLAPLVPWLLGPAYADSVPLFRILLVGELFMGAALMDTRISLGLGAVHRVSLLTVSWVAVAVPAYLWGSWAAGGLGAAVATVLLYLGYAATIRLRRPPAALDAPT